MKNWIKILVACVIMLSMHSCIFFPDNTTEIGSRADLIGKWQNVENDGQYIVFYDEAAEEGYCWGKEWDEGFDMYEEDLEYHGNGWLMWMKNSNSLSIRAMISISTAEADVTWTLQQLDSKQLVYNDGKRVAKFQKVNQ